MQEQQIKKLTLAGMFAALAFACFSYLRIEIPMGLGLTGKIYVGHASSCCPPWCWEQNTEPFPGPSAWPWQICWPDTPPPRPHLPAKFLLGWSTAWPLSTCAIWTADR